MLSCRRLRILEVGLIPQPSSDPEQEVAPVAQPPNVLKGDVDIYAHINKGDALQSLGGLLGSLSCYEEAEKVYGEAVAVLDEAISLAPDFTFAYFKRGNALFAQGDMLASISRFEDAQRTFSDAVAAYDEELNRVPDNVGVHLMKALALVNQGRSLQISTVRSMPCALCGKRHRATPST